jgi:hypothetical protein
MYHKGHSRDPINVEMISDRNTLERIKPIVIGPGPVQVNNTLILNYESKKFIVL